MVLWFIGLSGSGKTTLSTLLFNQLKPQIPNLVRLDGDVLRDVFNNDVDHTLEGRYKNAHRLSHLSKMLSDQNIHVIAAVLSISEWQKWNLYNIPDYAQVYIKVPKEVLYHRDTKNLYKPALEKQIQNVVGVDIPFPEPQKVDLTLDNTQDRSKFQTFIDQVIQLPQLQKIISR
jgi:cytidine diphosphoramidate kinase